MFENLPFGIKNVVFTGTTTVPRFFGLSSVKFDMQTCKLSKSNFWRVYIIIYACVFAVSYPFAIIAILAGIRKSSKSRILVYIDVTNYIATYIFCLAVYLNLAIASTKGMILFNAISALWDECKVLCKDNREFKYLFNFILQALYLYIGNVVLNAITLAEYSESLTMVPFVYKFLYYFPDLIMATSMLRFRSIFSLFVMCCQRINQAFSECMHHLEECDDKSSDERLNTIFRARYTFDKIAQSQENLYHSIKGNAALFGALVIFSILKAFAHLSSTVKTYQHLKFWF